MGNTLVAWPRTFILWRDKDVSGVSGIGKVAEGAVFTDGTVGLRWCAGEHRSTVIWDSLESVEKIHGHDGKTRIIFEDTEIEFDRDIPFDLDDEGVKE